MMTFHLQITTVQRSCNKLIHLYTRTIYSVALINLLFKQHLSHCVQHRPLESSRLDPRQSTVTSGGFTLATVSYRFAITTVTVSQLQHLKLSATIFADSQSRQLHFRVPTFKISGHDLQSYRFSVTIYSYRLSVTTYSYIFLSSYIDTDLQCSQNSYRFSVATSSYRFAVTKLSRIRSRHIVTNSQSRHTVTDSESSNIVTDS